jgi:Acetyltransferase (GNAT) family.
MDLLVKLYELPDVAGDQVKGVTIRRAFAAEKHFVLEFVEKNFIRAWASECEVSFARLPAACFVASSGGEICGFACYDASARGFFGPIGVAENGRGHGIGTHLLIRTLQDMRARGYAYAIVGDVSDTRFYRQVNPIEIGESSPGFYRGMLKESERQRA